MRKAMHLTIYAAAGLLAGGSSALSQTPQTPLSQQGQADFGRILSPQQDRVSLLSTGQLRAFNVRGAANQIERLTTWNEIALQVTAADHARGPDEGYDHLGPHRSSRAMAIVHIAMYDAVNSITRKYKPYTSVPDADSTASVEMAIAVAARDALLGLYGLQEQSIRNAFRVDAVSIPGDDEAKRLGAAAGAAAAKAILDLRKDDQHTLPEPDFGTEEQARQDPTRFIHIKEAPGKWQPDPISKIKVALGYHWAKVTPFVIKSADAFRPAPPPATTEAYYAEMYREVVALGGDATHSPTVRKPFETFRGIFWAYDGTPGLCAPPRLYNQVALQVVEQNAAPRMPLGDVSDFARLLAVLNTAMADAGIGAWEAKWHYSYWRPITAIRTHLDDGNPQTQRIPDFHPLGAPATNARGPNFTPPFPAYPSGHATFGGAIFEVLRHYYGEHASVEVISDEFNGRNREAGTGPARERKPMAYARLSEPEWENARSRIWLGIHWQVDADAGVKQGNEIARYVLAHAFLPR